MKQPLFSVIIPLYNKELYIADTLSSVLNQTFSDFEVIIINDCSTDKSVAKVATIANEQVQIIHHKNNQGLSASRNTGFNYAKGEIICLLDADDLWKPNFLTEIHNLYQQFPEAQFYGTEYEEQFFFGTLRTNKTISAECSGSNFLVDDFFSSNLGQPIVCQSSLTFKKSILGETTHLFDASITYAEDIDFYIKAFSKYKLAYCYKPLVTYRNDIPNQMVYSSIADKKYPDFKSYEHLATNNVSLQKYIDFHRYSFAINLRLEGSTTQAKKLINDINFNNINSKQQFLLKSPLLLLKSIKAVKAWLLKKNIKVSTY
ncbi:glycosyltransferase family 2 protein [Neptunitalea lumnitzerae]|uniref:Glycosyl transferase n=1 Tax=Neptunitalea lumnitzerae TaxID=2965509 RepID=A0ABQ5MKR7_9FLAO|nr:glycosyltransferase [Neptunitalea sp. Y10]GLB50003.1 glycosyl transferase [Neptunitalea sp. Y10]